MVRSRSKADRRRSRDGDSLSRSLFCLSVSLSLCRVGRENWEKHLLRDDSAVQDVVGGVVRSLIVCPAGAAEDTSTAAGAGKGDDGGTCGKVSITFDYTSTVQLAIPQGTRGAATAGGGRRSRSNSCSSSSGGGRNRLRTVSGNSQVRPYLCVSVGRHTACFI